MAILYGTTSNGTTLPVLVDQFGNLLAKGIDGEPGTPGLPGPPGPPGIGQLPDDPFEGAVLGWQDGELAWLGGSVPLPLGTYGPFVYNDAEGTLFVPQDVDSLVNGQQLFQSDKNGIEAAALVRTSDIQTVLDGPNGTKLLSFVDGNFNFDKFKVGDVVQMPGNLLDPSNPLSGTLMRSDGSIANAMLYALRINGTELIQTNTEYSQYLTNDSGGWNTSYPAANAFDGNKNTVASGPSGWWHFAPELVFSNISSIETWDPGSYDGYSLAFQFYGSNGTTGPLGSTGEWRKVTFDDEAAITDIQPNQTTPLITVSGGKWLGTDGSGTPGGETSLSMIKEGAGSVLIGTGNSIILRNNNGEWVDGLYVTAPEQQIAARRVVTAAVKRTTN